MTLGNLSTDVFESWKATGNLFFSFLECFLAIMFVMSSHSHQQKFFKSVVRSKTTPKEETLILTSGCHPWLMNLGSVFERYSFAYIDFNSDSSFVCVCVGEGRGSREYNHFPYPSVLVSPLPFSNDLHHFVGSHHGLCVWMNYLLVVHHSRCPKANPGGLLRNVRDKEMRMRPSCKTEKRSHWAKIGLKKVQQYRV